VSTGASAILRPPGEAAFERQVNYLSTEAEPKESIEKKIRKLRKDFQKNVQPVLRRHNYYLSKGERRRIKKKKAIKRIQRRERRMMRSA
jgi:ribosomal protein S21